MRTLFFLFATVLAGVSLPAFGGAASGCRIGAYRLVDGSVVDVAPSAGDTLRWRRLDGMTGALQKIQNETWKSTSAGRIVRMARPLHSRIAKQGRSASMESQANASRSTLPT